MLAYFTRLFNYDYQTNLAIIDLIASSGVTLGKHISIMAHMLAAQQIWLQRCKKTPVPATPQWPGWSVDEMKAIAIQNHNDCMVYLNSLSDSDFKENITYNNSQGVTFTNALEDILAHLVNHGTHHRAQVGQLLKFEGVERLPVTDYILYIRGL